jgi:thioredoxin-related protein
MKQFFILIMPLLLACYSSLADSNSDYADAAYDDHEYSYADLPPVEILPVTDFEALGKQAQKENKIILLEMSSSLCEYCRLLEEEILKPMLRSGDYDDTVLIRQIKIDSHLAITGFDGSETTPARFSEGLRIYVTPTLLILDHRGREASQRIIGINSLDFFAARVDEALIRGRQQQQSALK